MDLRLIKPFVILFCLNGASVDLDAQCPDSAALNLAATLYTQEDGLTSTMTVMMAKDTIGYMYFIGVDDKWNRFDGVNFNVTGYIPTEQDINYLGVIADSPYDQRTIGQYLIKYGNKQEGSRAIIITHYLYIAGTGTVLYEVDLDNQEARKIDLANYINADHPSGMEISTFQIYKDLLLIGTTTSGLLIYNRCKNTIQRYQYEKHNSINDLTNSVVWISVDTENVIWMQTDGGLIKLEVNHQFIKTYMPSSAKHVGVCSSCNNVRAIGNRDDDHLLIGSLGGLYTFDLITGQFSYLLSPTDQQPVWKDLTISSITDDGNGNIFISSWGNIGILLLSDDEKKLLNLLTTANSINAPFEVVRCLFYDSHHVLWAGTNHGFLRITKLDAFIDNHYTGKVDISDRFPGTQSNHIIPSCTIFAIAEDTKGNIWLGTSAGLYIYQYETGDVISFVHNVNNVSSLSDNEIRSIYISKDDDAWIGTNNGGLNHFNASTLSFSAFTTENGLPNNSIYTIMEDHNGFLWLGTNGGLCRFNKADHSVRTYTPRDGIQNYEFNTNAVAMTNDGRICFGGRTGFNIFHPDSMNIELDPPTVVISKFKIFDKEYPVLDSVYQLAHHENTLTFDFAALSYYRSNDNQYTYMLEGADKDWIKSGKRTYTSYNNLSPGTYNFKVRAANYTDVWSENIASLKFIISPAWYNTWAFRSVMLLLVASGVYIFYRYRLQQIMKLQTVRNRIASDLHDEIGSTLSSISLSSTIMQNKLNGSNTEVEKLLHQVSINTDKMMEALSDIVWAINTKNDRFDNIVNRMRAFAVEMCEPNDINIQFNMSENISDVQLDMQQRKNLYLIFKEAVNNIVKYSGCTNVLIHIGQQGGKMLFMTIKDDGKGFEVPVPGSVEIRLSGNGIRNMKKRAQELGGQLTVDSAHGEGTMVQLGFRIGK